LTVDDGLEGEVLGSERPCSKGLMTSVSTHNVSTGLSGLLGDSPPDTSVTSSDDDRLVLHKNQEYRSEQANKGGLFR
jgi:hypothetical protein